MRQLEPSAPVAIAGVGGSGTRVIAEVLINLGFYMGSDLNHANDNLGFTLLFKRPGWFTLHAKNKELIFKGLDTFTRAMTRTYYPLPSELGFIARAVAEFGYPGYNQVRDGSGIWPLKRAWEMVRPRRIDCAKYIGWGWKEPNTHIYIEYLKEHFKDLRFVLIMRHGLDMAYSDNQQQLFNWGRLFGVEIPNSAKLLPRAALEYWVRANRRAIALGREMGDDRFLLLDFDKLCASPQPEIEKLITFLGLDTGKVDSAGLFSLFKVPDSIGRYREHDLSIFDPRDIEAVREFGFTVEI